MARSILPLRIREHLNRSKWVEYSKTSGVEAYTKGPATIYIQPSKADPEFFAWVIDFADKRSSIYGSGVIESLYATIGNNFD